MKQYTKTWVKRYVWAEANFYPYAWSFGAQLSFCVWSWTALSGSVSLAFGPFRFTSGAHR